MNGGDRELPPLGPEATELMQVARKTLGQLTPVESARGRDRLQARLMFRRGRGARALGFALLGGAAASAIVLVAPRLAHLGERTPGTPPPLAFHLDGGRLGPAGAIEASNGAEPALRFGDGTVITLARGTQGRLGPVDGHGAEVSIADGTASVSVVPKPLARWRVDAGPFSIHVHGTVFTAAWNQSRGRLDVRLERGSVSVEGPVTGGPIAMRAGQRLTVALRQSRVLLRALDDPDEDLPSERATVDLVPAPLSAPPPAERPASGEPAPAAATARSSSRPARRDRAWAAALAAGDFGLIVDEAETNLPRTLRVASADELAALADAARYRRRDDLAREALMAERRRFPSSARAADAAFFLGRLDENGGGGLIRALRWYDRYLDDAPGGSYAAEALGRKMVALRELYGDAAAVGVADEYVRRFPGGSYAGTARALRGER